MHSNNFIRFFLFVAMAFFSLWLIGLTTFSWCAFQATTPPQKTDGIVVLTGGKERIGTALDLLKRGFGRVLLISGVDRRTTLSEIAHGTHIALTPELTKMITLGQDAITTVGNATETRQWARAHHVRNLLVVTAGYHIQRAMMEIRRAAPEIQLHAFAVRPPALTKPFRLATLRLLITEYDKLLGASLGLSRTVNIKPSGSLYSNHSSS